MREWGYYIGRDRECVLLDWVGGVEEYEEKKKIKEPPQVNSNREFFLAIPTSEAILYIYIYSQKR